MESLHPCNQTVAELVRLRKEISELKVALKMQLIRVGVVSQGQAVALNGALGDLLLSRNSCEVNGYKRTFGKRFLMQDNCVSSGFGTQIRSSGIPRNSIALKI